MDKRRLLAARSLAKQCRALFSCDPPAAKVFSITEAALSKLQHSSPISYEDVLPPDTRTTCLARACFACANTVVITTLTFLLPSSKELPSDIDIEETAFSNSFSEAECALQEAFKKKSFTTAKKVDIALCNLVIAHIQFLASLSQILLQEHTQISPGKIQEKKDTARKSALEHAEQTLKST